MPSKPSAITIEAEKLLKVREPTVRPRIYDRELRAIKLGRELRMAVKDLEAFINQHATFEPSWHQHYWYQHKESG
ncbi:helix-turn-helix domain-containing protein [Exilibacterium tricleocarpae]|uniref:Helix-turn-helix domain-containing protein n=1 Tax=Exilibacterium tricleocarpae TaxID=2591008 RepID=A0A545T0P4_9GAMM|nr:helix-turn-helix domain-containing protein [Exilibacterium tricleocarpae]TQV70798.1 helix-turn-helix domain-containing protein [Exilibacterium tricleocarpae]